MGGRLAGIGLRIWVAGVLAFLFVPIGIICFYAFNSSNVQSWPIRGLSTRWFAVAWNDPQVRAALLLSVKAAVLATVIALLLGSAAAFGVHRYVPVVIAARLTGDGGITRGSAQNLRLGPVNQLMRAVPMAVKNGTVLARAPDRLVPACSSGMAPCSSGNAAARRVPAPVAASRMPAGARRSAADVALPAGAGPGMAPWPCRAVSARALPRAR
jgi:hypothetical protein